jgi:phosphoribosylformylglycinamidine synthase
VLSEPDHWDQILKGMLSQPNICSKEWITRQYDHEVQGSSVIKPLVGTRGDMVSDGSVIRPVLDRDVGLAYSQALLPAYSAIDAYQMVMCTVDEGVRRVLAVGGDPDHIGGVDNFCWPNIQYDSQTNPDGKFKAAQLVRACRALKDICLAYEVPLLSGKDSMYVDGYLPDGHGIAHKVSALETMQFSAVSRVKDINRCVTMESKTPGDLIFILGTTYNELGGSEFYEFLGYTGKNVPQVRMEANRSLYRAIFQCLQKELASSVHGIYRGGLGVHLALMAIGGDLGMEVELSQVPCSGIDKDTQLLFSESAGRFLVTVSPDNIEAFEHLVRDQPVSCIGRVTEGPMISVRGIEHNPLFDVDLDQLRLAWQDPFGDLR